jgi:hypothetical protein
MPLGVVIRHIFFLVAQAVGDGRGDGAPGFIGVFKEGEFGQDDVGAVAAHGVGLARHGDDSAAASHPRGD